MKIVLDFDDTIFNTHRLFNESVKIFERFGFTEKEFQDAYQKCKEKVGDFDLEIIANLIFGFNNLKPDKKKIKEEMNILFGRASDFVYSDFFSFINNFNKKDLILLSFGTTDFQGMKIENSGIASYFQEVIITQEDKTKNLKNILQQSQDDKNEDERIFFIDDKAEQIDKVKKELPQIITMKMERPQGGHLKTKSKLTDYVVRDLDEAKICIRECRTKPQRSSTEKS